MILDFEKNGGAAGVFHGMDEADLQKFMRHPNTMVASDSGLREFGKDVPHPRGYGNNARVLGQYVREQHVLRLEDAIRKMTSLPAATFRFTPGAACCARDTGPTSSSLIPRRSAIPRPTRRTRIITPWDFLR